MEFLKDKEYFGIEDIKRRLEINEIEDEIAKRGEDKQ